MKLELKTENEKYSKSFTRVLSIFFKLSLIIIFCQIALKLEIISRYYLIDYKCKLLSVEKSKPNFKELSSLSNLKSKQRIWEFCMEVIK